MKVGVIIPDRGDRPEFLKKCLEFMSRQTLQPDFIEIVNDKPLSNEKDIALRYRIGYERLKKCDVIIFIENDDWYSDRYIKVMVDRWLQFDKPLMLGLNKTTYYHIKSKKYCNISHPRHSSAMSMLLAGNKEFDFGPDTNPFVDLYLWKKYRGLLFDYGTNINLGIKHGIGISGGIAHNVDWKGYDKQDTDGNYLRNLVGQEDYEFYTSL